MKCFVNVASLIILLIFLVTSLFSRAFALEKPMKLSTDGRIEVVAFVPNQVIPVQGTNLTTTQITFNKKEFIENVQNGDLGAWTVSISPTLPNMLFLKPTVPNSNTNMTVVTNKRVYYFHLYAEPPTDADQAKATYAIHFIYPAEARARVEKKILAMEQQREAELSAFQTPQNYHWNYSFNGDARLVPLHVFDDGKFTYFQLQPNQPVPAVFAVTDPDGNESVVNDRQDGSYLVVQRVAPQFTLRVGTDEVATIFNNTMIQQLSTAQFMFTGGR